MMFILLIQKNVAEVSSFTNITATTLNVILYVLPLIVMLLGAFSLTEEFEDGRFMLLQTYPFQPASYMKGKFLGQFITHFTVITFSFGVYLFVNYLFRTMSSLQDSLLTYLFSLLLMGAFLAIGMTIGGLSKNRWQAFMIVIMIWFIAIMIWPMLLIGVLSLVPYQAVRPALLILSMLNPAELLRIFFVIQFDGGAVFGQPYYKLIDLLKHSFGWVYFLLYLSLYVLGMLSFSSSIIGRKLRDE